MHAFHSHIQRIFKIRSKIQEVYWNLILQTFAKSLIGTFIPIYLLTIGFTLHHVLVFAIFYFGMLSLFSPFSASLTARVGFKHLILYHLPVFVFFQLVLLLMQFIPFPDIGLYLAALVGGISLSLYWIPLNAEFVKNIKRLHVGEEIATSIALPRLFSIATPIIAALILTAFGFPTLFFTVISLALFSVIPLFATGDYRTRFSFLRQLSFLLKSKSHSGQQAILGLLSIMEAFIWPIFIFISLGSLLDVGLAAAISGVGIAFFTYMAGKLSDRVEKRTMMKIGGLAYALVWFLRIFASTPLEIYLLSLLGGMFASVLEISIFSIFCSLAKGKNILDWTVTREFWLGAGRVVAPIILLLLGSWLQGGFALAGLASLLLLVL